MKYVLHMFQVGSEAEVPQPADTTKQDPPTETVESARPASVPEPPTEKENVEPPAVKIETKSLPHQSSKKLDTREQVTADAKHQQVHDDAGKGGEDQHRTEEAKEKLEDQKVVQQMHKW